MAKGFHNHHIPTKVGIAALAVLTAGAVLFMNQLGQNQDVRSRASESSQSPTAYCKEGVKSFRVLEKCRGDKFQNASYTCQDGKQGILGGKKTCKTSEEWRSQAREICKGHSTCMSSPSPAVSNPDLFVKEMRVTLDQDHTGTYLCKSGLGLRVLVVNLGSTAAGAFTIKANKTEKIINDGLAASSYMYVWIPDYVYSGENTASVSLSKQTDADPTNNKLIQMLPIPTPPSYCVNKPTPTPNYYIPTPTPN